MGDLDASQAFWAKITTCVGVTPVADVKRSLRMTKLQQYQKLGATVSLYSVKETLSMAFDDAVQGSGEVSDRRPTVGGTGRRRCRVWSHGLSFLAPSLVHSVIPSVIRSLVYSLIPLSPMESLLRSFYPDFSDASCLWGNLESWPLLVERHCESTTRP